MTVKAFQFSPNVNTANGFESEDSGTWSGFSAESQGTIDSGIPIRLVFKGKIASGKTVDDVVTDLQAAGNVVGTGEVDGTGALVGSHTAVIEVCKVLTAPTCKIVGLTSTTVDLEFFDLDDGLQSIVVSSSKNVDATIDSFTPGTFSSVDVQAEKIDSMLPGYIWFRACDTLGACVRCDPVAADLVLVDKGRLEETFIEVVGEDRYLMLENGGPGVRHIEVNVNGKMIYNLAGIKDGEKLHFDINAGLESGIENVITVVASGRPGGSVFMALGDIPLNETVTPEAGRVQVRSVLGLKALDDQ